MNLDVSLIGLKNSLDLNIPIFYPRMLACLEMTAMTAASGVLLQLVASVIDDLRVEFSIEPSPANHASSTLPDKN